jgi:hypothetical protein
MVRRIAPLAFLGVVCLACTHAAAPESADAGVDPCDDYAHVLAVCRGTGPEGELAMRAQASFADQMRQAPGGAALLAQRCRQLAGNLRLDPACVATLKGSVR